jgi:hypothetical protein
LTHADRHSQVSAIIWHNLLGILCSQCAVEQAGKVLQIGIQLLHMLEEYPDGHLVWFMEGIGYEELLPLSQIMSETSEQLVSHTVIKGVNTFVTSWGLCHSLQIPPLATIYLL